MDTKKKLIKDLEKFGFLCLEIIGGEINLHDRRKKSIYQQTPYVGTIKIKDNSYYEYQENIYKTPKQLSEAIENFNKTLPWPSELEDPTYRKGVALGLKLNYYLREILGFTKKKDKDLYYLSDGIFDTAIELGFEIPNEDKTEGKVFHNIPSDEYIYQKAEFKFDSQKTAIEALNSFINIQVLLKSGTLMNLLEKTFSGSMVIPNKVSIDSRYNLQVKSMKDSIIEKLEETLLSLKKQ